MNLRCRHRLKFQPGTAWSIHLTHSELTLAKETEIVKPVNSKSVSVEWFHWVYIKLEKRRRLIRSRTKLMEYIHISLSFSTYNPFILLLLQTLPWLLLIGARLQYGHLQMVAFCYSDVPAFQRFLLAVRWPSLPASNSNSQNMESSLNQVLRCHQSWSRWRAGSQDICHKDLPRLGPEVGWNLKKGVKEQRVDK